MEKKDFNELNHYLKHNSGQVNLLIKRNYNVNN